MANVQHSTKQGGHIKGTSKRGGMCGPLGALLDLVDVLQDPVDVHVASKPAEKGEADRHQKYVLQSREGAAEAEEGNK